ncbi:MAG: NmrA family NAD(P)-binding protein [Chloroflexi bacterium]|nr:NmrA family NAD(P)-binding protein [Chloroflexota bacterium]
MILVSGAAGKTGLAVLKALRAKGVGARAMVRSQAQEAAVLAAGASESVVGNMEIEADLSKALRGVEAVYLIVPNVHPKEVEIGKATIAAALTAGVERFVYHSVLFPQIERMPHHWRKLLVEETLIQSSLNFTILQPANYMQNVLAYWEAIQDNGVLSLPYSIEARSTPVDLKEVAEVVAKVLTEKGHSGAIYPLAGPELLSSREMAAQMGRALGRDVQAERMELAVWEEAAKGLDAERRETLKQMFAYYDERDFVGNASVLRHLLGREPMRFAEFLERMAG